MHVTSQVLLFSKVATINYNMTHMRECSWLFLDLYLGMVLKASAKH